MGKGRMTGLAAAAALLALALALAPGAGAQPAADDGGPWRLFRQYQHLPGPQEGFAFWVSAPDLAAAEGEAPQVRMMVLDLDSGGWSIGRTEYLCGRGQARGLGLVRYGPDGAVLAREPAETEAFTLIPHIPDGAVYSVVCNDAAPGEVEAADVAAAFDRQRADHQAWIESLAD